ncbi:S-layer homology domain-containing protein [Lysinibacillus sp. 1P01SD]|uniref:S-layer homology domain-containing protein n=1 Tax=Lysinibacillus sp. 1P01SD TaxID=3132285 RepID=UPI0039A29A20
MTRKKRWLRSLSAVLSLSLITSSVSFLGIQEKAQAEDSGDPVVTMGSPGGVNSGLISWVDVEKSAGIKEGEIQIPSLTDLATEGNWSVVGTVQNDKVANALNFNGGIHISSGKGYYSRSGADFDTKSSARDIFSVQKSDNYSGFPWEWGGSYTASSQYGLNNGQQIRTYFGSKKHRDVSIGKHDLKNGSLMNIWSATNDWGLSLNGKILSNDSTNETNFTSPITSSNSYYFGAGHNSRFNGIINETIVYNRKLEDNERKKVNSYLALKYGITLKDDGSLIDYIASDGSTMWKAINNTDYGNHITGIGRDDNGALYQKQSKSQVNGANITISLGNEIQATNAENLNTITNDKSFFMFSDNGQDATFATPLSKEAEQLQHTKRIYKIEKTNWSDTDITLQIEKVVSATDWPLYLVISADDQFDTSDSFHQLTDGKVTLDSSKFTNGAYFTIAAPVPTIESASLEHAQAGGNQITLTFDKDIKLTSGEGFTITVSGNTITNAIFTVDPADAKKLIITLPADTVVTGNEVKIDYNTTQGSLKGTSGVSVSNFEVQIVNKELLQAKINEAEGLTASDYTAETWAAYQEQLTAAQNVLNDPNATQEEVNQALADLTIAQEALQKVTGVNKELLQSKVDEATGLLETDYTPETWANYQSKLTAAQNVLDDPDATQEEVDQALADLTIAYKALEKVSGVNKAPLQAKVEEAGGLTASDYTPETWAAYQEQLAAAQNVLDDPNATQEEVNQALADLTVAQEALQKVTGVNKEPLQSKVDEATGLLETDYTPETWANYQSKLTAAQHVLDDPDATQEELDQALANLTVAQEALQKITGVNKEPLQSKVDEATGLTETDYTPETWANYQSKLTAAQNVLHDPKATQEEVNQALADLTVAQKALKPVVITAGLGSLVPSQGALNPSFSSEVTDYTMNVDYATSQLSFLATPIIPGASVTTTVNGQLGTLEQIPLQVGENIIVITVADGNGNVKHYTIKVYREAYTGGGNSGGGGTWTPNPTPPVTPTPSETKTKIQVELEIDGDNPLEKTTVEIERTKHANGDVTDFVNLTPAQALEAVEKAKQIGNSIARIVIPDVKDEVDQVTVEVPKQSLQTLRDNGLSLEISTENGHIAIPHSSMEGIDDNFYFRLVPVKKESERQAIEERAKAEQVVRETLESDDVHVVARPMTIETNMPSRPVQVTLPLKGVNVPTVAAERQAFLDQLAVFIEHSDGEKKVVFPEVVTMAKGELGLRFTVEKFSTFTIIQFEKPEVSEHEAYIKGFPNGTFGPDKNVTRAQIAIMMARILGYTEGQAVHKAPFKDVAKDHSAAGAIAFVKEQGIMNGDQYGNFHANANITRAEMAAVVANYKQLSVEEGAAITFKDTKGHWAQWIIEANRASGIINGLEDGSFAPNAALTRAQAVVIMNRMFERGPLHGVTEPSFLDVKATHWAFKEIEEAANSHKYFIDEEGKEQLSK